MKLRLRDRASFFIVRNRVNIVQTKIAFVLAKQPDERNIQTCESLRFSWLTLLIPDKHRYNTRYGERELASSHSLDYQYKNGICFFLNLNFKVPEIMVVGHEFQNSF